MDNANYAPKMLLDIASSDLLAADPFVLVDVGCGLGIDDAWRLFSPHLHAHGFDPQLDEVARLSEAELDPNIHYHAALVGRPDAIPREPDSYFEPFGRTSAIAAIAHVNEHRPATSYETNDWGAHELVTRTVGLADFLPSEGVEQIDFVKIDTDGGDFDVLRSFEDMIEDASVLGFMVEAPFTGSSSESSHSFHNIDRLLKRHGFLLCTLSVNRYSRAALPAPFVYPILAQTTWGQVQWADVVYLRDGAHSAAGRYGELSRTKLLKLACLYELFQTPDCAVEILLAHREELATIVDVDRLLDLLTPPLNGREVSYREYIAAFERDPTSFYPPPEEPPPEPPPPSPAQRARGFAARLLRRDVRA